MEGAESRKFWQLYALTQHQNALRFLARLVPCTDNDAVRELRPDHMGLQRRLRQVVEGAGYEVETLYWAVGGGYDIDYQKPGYGRHELLLVYVDPWTRGTRRIAEEIDKTELFSVAAITQICTAEELAYINGAGGPDLWSGDEVDEEEQAALAEYLGRAEANDREILATTPCYRCGRFVQPEEQGYMLCKIPGKSRMQAPDGQWVDGPAVLVYCEAHSNPRATEQ